MGVPAQVHDVRIEAVVSGFAAGGIEVVTARALASLKELVAWTEPLLKSGAVGLFPKGREVQSELTEAAKSWRLDADLIPSRTDPQGRIVRIRSLREPA
jgi:16S rRNA (guanine527-N7)-methyltransferase